MAGENSEENKKQDLSFEEQEANAENTGVEKKGILDRIRDVKNEILPPKLTAEQIKNAINLRIQESGTLDELNEATIRKLTDGVMNKDNRVITGVISDIIREPDGTAQIYKIMEAMVDLKFKEPVQVFITQCKLGYWGKSTPDERFIATLKNL